MRSISVGRIIAVQSDNDSQKNRQCQNEENGLPNETGAPDNVLGFHVGASKID